MKPATPFRTPNVHNKTLIRISQPCNQGTLPSFDNGFYCHSDFTLLNYLLFLK